MNIGREIFGGNIGIILYILKINDIIKFKISVFFICLIFVLILCRYVLIFNCFGYVE